MRRVRDAQMIQMVTTRQSQTSSTRRLFSRNHRRFHRRGDDGGGARRHRFIGFRHTVHRTRRHGFRIQCIDNLVHAKEHRGAHRQRHERAHPRHSTFDDFKVLTTNRRLRHRTRTHRVPSRVPPFLQRLRFRSRAVRLGRGFLASIRQRRDNLPEHAFELRWVLRRAAVARRILRAFVLFSARSRRACDARCALRRLRCHSTAVSR